MMVWYLSLDLFQRIFALIAILSTAVLIIQTVMLFFGIGTADAGDDRPALFSVGGIAAMLSVGGWSGIVMIEFGVNRILTVILAVVFGIAVLVGIAVSMKLLLRLQSPGNIDLSNAIGKTGQVNIPIPAKMRGLGKINIIIQDKYYEITAITEDDKDIRTGEMVRVLATDETGVPVVGRVRTAGAVTGKRYKYSPNIK
jgi:hypothetical protein